MSLLDCGVPAVSDVLGESDALPIEARRVHNARRPVSRLPLEITTTIFRLMAHADPPGGKLISHYGVSKALGLGWIPAATHVCHQWRTYALADPFLWALCAADMPNSRGFESLKLRAGETPLYLNNMRRALLTSAPDGSSEAGSYMPEHFYAFFPASQSCNLILRPDEARRLSTMIAAEGIPPSMHTLHVAMTRDSEEFIPRESRIGHFKSSSARLRHVTLSHLFIPFSSRYLISLRLFHKREQGWVPEASLLLDILSDATDLESLWFHEWNCDIPTSSSLTMPKLLELRLNGSSTGVATFASALLCILKCPRLKSIQCECALSAFLSSAGPEPSLVRLTSRLRIGDEHPVPASSTYFLKMWGRKGRDHHYTFLSRLGDIPDDPRYYNHGTYSADSPLRLDTHHMRLFMPYAALSDSHYEASALRTSSELGLYDLSLDAVPAASVFQSIVNAHALQHETLVSTVEILHFGLYFPTEGIDWSPILAPFTSVHELILVNDEPSISHEGSLIVAMTHCALHGNLLLPSLGTLRLHGKVPWRLRDAKTIRALAEARASCGASPFRIRPLIKPEWQPAVLSYLDSLIA